MYEYVCYTKQGNWRFYADSDIDAMRLSLFYCWRDNEDFSRWKVQLSASPIRSVSAR